MDSSLAHLVSWSESSRGHVPPALTGPSITISPLPSPNPPTVFLFGGKLVNNRQLTDQMWAMDLTTREWTRINAGPGPGPRYFHSMDVWEDKLVCFGGMSDTDPMSVHDDIWFFDCRTRKWLPQEQESQDPAMMPSARYAHLSAVSRGKLVVSGGQHADNSWVYEINVYDLVARRWISKTPQPEASGLHSRGAYRSVAVSSKQRVLRPRGGAEAAVLSAQSAQSYSLDEDGEGGDIYCYSNYDFAKVRRELDVFTPSDEVAQPPLGSHKQTSPPDFSIEDQSARMRGSTQPPGLRFPTGGIVGNHFILCGLYLASSSAAFSIWSLDLTTLVWRRLEPAVLNTGSWNRAVVWPEQAKLLVFGNSEYDIASDYGRRAVNLDHVAVVSLEAYGIYRPPKLEVVGKVQSNSMTALDEQLASDFEVVCENGRRVKCSRQVLSQRWPWFAAEQQLLSDRLAGVVRDAPALDIADTLLGSFTPARLAPTHLTMPEPFPVCVALVQYFYTLSLSTALQNRAPVLSALLFLSKQYKIERLGRLVVHALHERLEPSNAVGIYEIATLAGERNLQVRALHMIHSAKNGPASRSHKQGPLANQPGEDAREPSTVPAGTNQPFTGRHEAETSVAGGPAAGGAVAVNGSTTAAESSTRVPGNTRTCRPESLTLGAEEVADVDDLIAALTISANEAIVLPSPDRRCSSPVPELPSVSRRSSARGAPTIGSTPSSRMFRTQHVPALRTPEMPPPDLISDRESTANSEWTCLVPATPVESIRESFIMPPGEHRGSDGSWQMDSRSSSSSGYGLGLPALPEDGRMLNRFKSISENSPKRPEPKISVPEETARPPPPPPQSLSSIQAQAIATHFTNADPFKPGASIKNKHLSTATNSSISSISSRQDLRLLVPSSPVSTEFSFTHEDSSRGSPANSVFGSSLLSPKHALHLDYQGGTLTALPQEKQPGAQYSPSKPPSSHAASKYASSHYAPSMAAMTTDSSSTYSGNSATSSEKAAKAEKRAIAAAAKAQKKAEAQAKFEALRSEQMQKMAVAKAEAQRKAEVAKFEPPTKAKAEPKSRLGRLGQKFTSAVLFPEGGNNSTMF